jgi:hypothetical protein
VTASTEIPAQEWSRFLEEFSRRHQGWLVYVEGDGTDLPPEVGTLKDPQLEAITAQLSGKDSAISVVVRTKRVPPGHTLYSIPSPSSLRVEEHGNGTEKRLIIGSQDHRRCIRLRQVVRPPA